MLKRVTKIQMGTRARADWLLSDLAARNPVQPGSIYAITLSERSKVISGPACGDSYWRVIRRLDFRELEADGRIWWGKSDGITDSGDQTLSLRSSRPGVVPQTLWSWQRRRVVRRNAKQELSPAYLGLESGQPMYSSRPKPVKASAETDPLLDRI